MDIGKKIRSRREELRLSCEEAAEMAGINPSTFQDIESGKVQFPPFGIVYQIESALNISLLTSSGDKQSSIGERIWLRRGQLGLSRTELAKRAGLHRATIANIETGFTPNPRGQNLRRIKEALSLGERPMPKGGCSLGEELRVRREELGLTQAEVARKAGVHRVTVLSIETNATPAPRGQTLRKIKMVLGLDTGSQQKGTPILYGEEIRMRREELDLTQADLAMKSGLHRSTIVSIENGTTPCPLEQTQKKIDEALRLVSEKRMGKSPCQGDT